MEKEEILNKVKEKKAIIGEMEKQKVNKGTWISLIAAGVIAVAFIIVECSLRHWSAAFAIMSICYAWASVQYFCQYFIAKRPWQVLIGAVLDCLAFVASVVLYILTVLKVIL